ncbi:MAG: ribonuclease III domain-containing protein [Clostridia bacterium]|jgi:ribonuclease-3 family protein
MQNDFFEKISDKMNLTAEEINQLSPLVLAYIGDSVYEVLVRTYMVSENGQLSVNKLHRNSIGFVKAHAQSETVHRLMDLLNEDELNIVRRGRNSKSGTVPKNADLTEYKYATGFEALIGYLYLKKDFNRLTEVFFRAVDVSKNKD